MFFRFMAAVWHYCRLLLATLSTAFCWLLMWFSYKGAGLLAVGLGLLGPCRRRTT